MTKTQIARMLADQDTKVKALGFWAYPDYEWQDQFQSHWAANNVSPESADAWEA
jgi:beta-xylosidase